MILMAASRELVNQLLAAAAKAKLDVVGMNVEPKALVDCFTHVYRRKSDADVTQLLRGHRLRRDAGGDRARRTQILFARTIPVGGDHFTRAVADGAEDQRSRTRSCCGSSSRTQQPAPATPATRSTTPRRPRRTIAAPPPSPTTPSDREQLLRAARRRHGRRRRSSATAHRRPPPRRRPRSAAAAADPAAAPDAAPTARPRPVEQACREPLGRARSKSWTCAAATTSRRSRASRSTGWCSSAARRGRRALCQQHRPRDGAGRAGRRPAGADGPDERHRHRERHRPPPAAARVGRGDRPEHGPAPAATATGSERRERGSTMSRLSRPRVRDEVTSYEQPRTN